MAVLALTNPPLLEHFSPAHLWALVVTWALGVGLILLARSRRQQKLVRGMEVMLAMLLLTSYPSGILARLFGGVEVNVDVVLPMHLCDVASITGFFALVFRHRLSAELTYFWGLAGTLQALFTPSTCYAFPNPVFFSYFQLHSGVVIAAFYLPLGLGWRPDPGVVLRVWKWGLVYLAFAGLVDLLLGANYGFLRSKAEGSLMEVLGPWPVYIIAMAGIALVAFVILQIPFYRKRGADNPG